ncbi:mannitol dehydrogenase family protein [Phaeovulum sp.]|uniref:mannitol dehydrogenase family protein n=1 Tax=Phaeovulum sp. TaxID=2934796 RepID=UPI002730F982|nr:mannitol dehydrogenase family protein [Phaeovulum sp.]MDP1668403.1 mannitol dehydrogenase family protein [Phaeovulum sp.]MDZ4120102.1 mannitol dehydrogenase family protein [Phaeovulum sp.]
MQTPILQFGTSRFLQAHADLFLSEALAAGQALGRVTVVQSSGAPERAGRLAALAAPEGFVVRVQGVASGRNVQGETRVTSIHRALSTAVDWPEIRRIAVEEAEIILSNTGDSGWVPRPQDGLEAFDQAMSYPAKLTQLLRARHAAGGRPIQIMPTELVAQNGARLRARVLDLAAQIDAGFAAWVAAEARFVNSLVDRIVSEALEPAGAVAEPYALWAIEDQSGLILPCRHPALRVVPDLAPVERLKLYILNLSHSYLVAGWLGPRRHDFVRQAMAEAAIRNDLLDLLACEVVPVFDRAGQGDAAQAYVGATLDRFDNPFLDHRLADIAQNHGEKVMRRIGGLISWAESLPGPLPPMHRLRAVLASVTPVG